MLFDFAAPSGHFVREREKKKNLIREMTVCVCVCVCVRQTSKSVGLRPWDQ